MDTPRDTIRKARSLTNPLSGVAETASSVAGAAKKVGEKAANVGKSLAADTAEVFIKKDPKGNAAKGLEQMYNSTKSYFKGKRPALPGKE